MEASPSPRPSDAAPSRSLGSRFLCFLGFHVEPFEVLHRDDFGYTYFRCNECKRFFHM